ncbi:MAG: four helix bundle protein [Planctomycetes bacterium]|nr:four helix bundle protein [Planctomycetota bacterium]
MRDYRQIKVWQKAHALALAVYRATTRLPTDERFGLTRELRRSATSVPSNIAEGCGRESQPDFGRFLSIAAGSASELDYQLLLARDLGYVSARDHAVLDAQAQEVKRMLNSFMQRLRAKG